MTEQEQQDWAKYVYHNLMHLDYYQNLHQIDIFELE